MTKVTIYCYEQQCEWQRSQFTVMNNSVNDKGHNLLLWTTAWMTKVTIYSYEQQCEWQRSQFTVMTGSVKDKKGYNTVNNSVNDKQFCS